LLGAVALALSGLTACSDHQSFIVVTLVSAGAPIAEVSAVTVTSTSSGTSATATRTYPGKGVTIPTADGNGGGPITLSVSFEGDRRGLVKLVIETINSSSCRVASGSGQTTIARGDVTALIITLNPHVPNCQSDGGADGSGDGNPGDAEPFPGCDPAMADTCGAGKTCYVDCKAGQSVCVAAGPAGPGQACPSDTSSCAQGTQCFAYSNTEAQCAVRVCLKFCKTDDDCTTASGVGLGPGSLCAGPVECNMQSTGHKTCTFACDPRSTARIGCPQDLNCFLVGEHDQVDCRCTPTASVKDEGQSCVGFSDCKPGLICTTMGVGTPQQCRRICKNGADGATDCAPGQACMALLNDTVYGICR
jgi:hypothetical protein